MSPIPGPFAPSVTRFAYDEQSDTVSTTGEPVQTLADAPGNTLEQDDPSGDVVTADRFLMLNPSPWTEYDEWIAMDGKRYRATSVSAYLNPFTGTAVTQVNLRRIT